MTTLNTYLQHKGFKRFTSLIKKQQFLAATAATAFFLVFAGVFISQNTYVISLAPEQIGLGQGVAACFGSLGPSCDGEGRNTLSFSWNATAAAGHWPNCDTNGDSTVRVNLHDSNNAFIQSLTSSSACAGSASFSRALTGGGGYKIWVLGNNSNHTYEEYTFTAMSCQQPTTDISGSINVSPDSPCVAARGSSTCAATVNWSTQGAQYSVAQAAGPLWPTGANLIDPTTSSSGSLYYNLPIGGYVFSVSGYNGSSWGNPLSQRNYYVAPAAPASMSATCNTGGTSVTLSWPASTGATTYYPRVSPVSWTVCTNPAGPNWLWIPDNGGTCYTDRWPYGTTVANFPVNPGTNYQAWVHAGDPVAWSHAAGTGTFSCTGAAVGTVQGYKVNSARQAAFAEQVITVQGGSQAPSSGTNPYFINGLAPTGYDVTSSVPAGYNVSYCTVTGCGAGQAGVYTPGSTVNVTVPSGGAVNIWWMYTAAAASPDLTVSGITPTSAITGIATTYSATITNTGGASTGIAFKNFYQVKSGTVGVAPKNFFARLFNFNTVQAAEVITDLPYSTMNALAAGAGAQATQAYTFPAAGTYSIRVCADKANSADEFGVIDEGPAHAGEYNNCGGWTQVNVTDPSGDPVGNFESLSCSNIVGWAYDPNSASTSISVHVYEGGTFRAGGVADISRPDVNNVFGITGKHGFSIPTPNSIKDGNPHTLRVYGINIGAGGNRQITNSHTVTCSPSCSVGGTCTSAANSCGQTNTGTYNGTCVCSVDTPAESLCPPTVSLSADPTRVRNGGSTKLTWSSSSVLAATCLLTGQNGFSSTAPSGTAVDSSTNGGSALTAQTNFTLTCTNANASKSANVLVNLIPAYIEQ